MRVGGPGVGGRRPRSTRCRCAREAAGEEPERAVHVHPGAVLVGHVDRLGERVERAGVDVAGLQHDDRRPAVVARSSAGRRASGSMRPWSSAATGSGAPRPEVAQRQVDGVVPLGAHERPAPRASRPGRGAATSQPARRSTSSRPAARQVKLAMVPPVTKPTALSAGRPSRSSSQASATSSTRRVRRGQRSAGRCSGPRR